MKFVNNPKPENEYIFKLALSILSPNDNTCISPQCLKKIYDMSNYAKNGIKSPNDGRNFKIDKKDKLLEYSSFIVSPRVEVNNNFKEYKVLKNYKKDELLRDISKTVYKTEKYEKTPVKYLSKILKRNNNDVAAIIFTCLKLDIPWHRFYKCCETEMTFNGFENRKGMDIYNGYLKIGTWKNSNVVIKLLCNQSDKSENDKISFLNLTIIIPGINIEEIYPEKKTMAKAVIYSNSSCTLLESLKNEILNYKFHDLKKLIEDDDYLRDYNDVRVCMPIVDIPSLDYNITKIDFENINFTKGAQLFEDHLSYLSKSGVWLQRILCASETKINTSGLSVEGSAMGFCYDCTDIKTLDIKYPFMFIISTDIDNVYSIGFMNE